MIPLEVHMQYQIDQGSHLHIHDVIVSRYHLVSHLYGRLKRDVGLLHRDHGITQAHLVIPQHKGLLQVLRLMLRLIDAVQRRFQHIGEIHTCRGGCLGWLPLGGGHRGPHLA